MNSKILKIGRSMWHNFPIMRTLLEMIYGHFFLKTKFSGWGMKTSHALPWDDDFDWEEFRKANQDIKKFEFSKDEVITFNEKNIDKLSWRHWIVSYAVRHAIKFAQSQEYNFAECGSADGISAFFALHEIKAQKIKKFSMHLYDSWEGMKIEYLKESEVSRTGNYSNLELERTKHNLRDFADYLVFHKGFIPESLNVPPESPKSIVYLHIDLNSTKPTIDAINFFLPRLVKGGIILFDDYGWSAFRETKNAIDEFFHGTPGMLMKIPTGQAIYFV